MSTMVNRYIQDNPDLITWKQKAEGDNFTKFKSDDLLKRLPQIFEKGLLYHKNQENQNAYIFLTRYLYIVNLLQKRNLNADQRKKLNEKLKVKEAKEVQEAIIRTVNASILSTNNISDKSVNNSENSKSLNKNNSSDRDDDDALNLPEIPTDEPLGEKVVDEFIQCTELFPIVQKGSRYLIIDIRSIEDYEKSRIKADRCINIPGCEIAGGKTAKKFEQYLQVRNATHARLYSERSQKYVDLIVLMDWDTNRSTLKPNNKLSILKDILTKWDPGVIVSKHLILKGGFVEWLNFYPSWTTNPGVSTPIPMDNTVDEMLEGISYPDWLPQDGSKSAIVNHPAKNNNNDIAKRQTDIPGLHGKITDAITNKRSKSMSISHYPSYEDDDVTMMNLSQNIDKFNFRDDRPIKPTIDRSSKPVATKNPLVEQLFNLITRITTDLKDQEKLEIQSFQLEQNIYEMLTKSSDDFNYEDDDDLESMVVKKNTVQQTISTILKSKEEKENELLKITENPIAMAKADEQQRMKLEVALGSMKKRLQDIFRQRKILQQKIDEAEKRRRLKDSPRHNDNSIIYKEPLKSEGSSTNSGLKRSLSSPNLAKMEDPKVPIIDRSSKPHIIRKNIREANNNIAVASWKDSFKRMDPIYRDTHPGITGLKNLGNSCYMNSIIQCLSNTAYLSKYFIDNGYQDDLNTNSDNETRGQIAEEFAQVIKALWRGQYKSIAPRDLKDTIGQYRLQFDSCEQQDSHEFLTFLLEWMHNDLRRDMKMRIDGPLSSAEKEWEKSMKGQCSIVSRLFMGQLRSTICCTTCSGKSITYETFTSLSISLPEANRCTLDECIRHFLSGQKISGWNCPHCKTAREATKKFDFVKLAPIMIIHLNRFAGTDVGLEKKNTSVAFPLHDLNLKPYLAIDPDSITLNHHNYSYNLYGLSNHYGSMGGGHYTAFCKSAALNKWYKYDDHSVSEISEQNVKSQNSYAYLLFYTSIACETYTFIDESS